MGADATITPGGDDPMGLKVTAEQAAKAVDDINASLNEFTKANKADEEEFSVINSSEYYDEEGEEGYGEEDIDEVKELKDHQKREKQI